MVMVDAIEDGKIVRVNEEYAQREGLLIVKKPEPSALDSPSIQRQMKLTPRLRGERKSYFDIEKYRRPWHDKNDMIANLDDNFRWILSSKRKQLNISRKQLAQSINASEEDLKLLENGVLPHNDYVLISKLENYLKVSLRKSNNISSSSISNYIEGKSSLKQPKWASHMKTSKPEEKAEEILSEVELIEDESENPVDKG